MKHYFLRGQDSFSEAGSIATFDEAKEYMKNAMRWDALFTSPPVAHDGGWMIACFPTEEDREDGAQGWPWILELEGVGLARSEIDRLRDDRSLPLHMLMTREIVVILDLVARQDPQTLQEARDLVRTMAEEIISRRP